MGGAYASAVPTQVVDHHAVRDWPGDCLPRHPVSEACAPIATDNPVAVVVAGAVPDETARAEVQPYTAPEALIEAFVDHESGPYRRFEGRSSLRPRAMVAIVAPRRGRGKHLFDRGWCDTDRADP